MRSSHAVHPLLLGEFLGSILLDCLVHDSHAIHPLLFGEFLGPILLESLVCNLRAVHPLLLGECLVQYHWNVLCTVCTLFIPYYLGNFLVQCYWIALYALCALFIPYCFLGNSCSHFILERLCFLCMPFFCHFSLGPSAPFPSHCLLCVSLALSSLVLLCHLPSSVGAPSKYFFCWHNLS